MYHVSTQGVDKRMINVHYYYYYWQRKQATYRSLVGVLGAEHGLGGDSAPWTGGSSDHWVLTSGQHAGVHGHCALSLGHVLL